VHLNPARAKMLAPASNCETTVGAATRAIYRPRPAAALLRVDRLLGEHGIRKDNAAGRLEF